ncbi:uncharacterized protein LOC122508819 [Leptopilina heterotoma]|uniref:uncharacterized protein LOC122508819 n=1 Tax=Leptopilina heterotoma TaxID=63436 RepID=UPI001CA8D756|nr:uncharacterized protein LOC122508819 [Leptopilina heterotoma]
MVDGNISMEEDTELRDLVVQTLENNGVLAKVRAELRASVFLALEEQESVMIPEPLLNKTVKQYLQSSEGKLLFSLVREFLEYFGLDYTISVYDPETYFGKEYNYVGRKKLCEELGISSTEPLLGEILKNNINGAFITSQKNDSNGLDELDVTPTRLNNATFEVSIPKLLKNSSSLECNDTNISEKVENNLSQFPLNVTITDKKKSEKNSNTIRGSSLSSNISNTESINALETSAYNEIDSEENCKLLTKTSVSEKKKADASEKLLHEDRQKLDEINFTEEMKISKEPSLKEVQTIQTDNTSKQETLSVIENNVQNKKKILIEKPFEKSVYFDEIIIDGRVEKVDVLLNKSDSLLGELPPLISQSNSIFSDLPPLNCKKTNISDLKQLMQIATDVADNYDEDFISSASGSANEQSPSKEPSKSNLSLKSPSKGEDTLYNEEVLKSDDISEEIEEIISGKSFLDDVLDKKVTKFSMNVAADYIEEI